MPTRTMSAQVLIMILIPLGLVLAGSDAAAGDLTFSSSPAAIILGQTSRATLTVQGLEGQGEVRAAVNVGAVQQIRAQRDKVVVEYQPPPEHYPQRLCLALWRAGSARVQVLRVPLLGQTMAPVTTRKNSQVTLTVAGQVFGPKSSGARGKVSVRVVVPPGTTEGQVEVVDDRGLQTQKTVSIQLPSYNPLTIAVEPPHSEDPRPAFSVTVVSSEQGLDRPALEIGHEEPEAGKPAPLDLAILPGEGWRATWRPAPGAAAGRYLLLARVPDEPAARRASELSWRPPEQRAAPAPPTVVKSPPAAEPGLFDRLGWTISLAAGLLHNTGALVSPRLSAEAGAELPALGGRIGARLLIGVAWDSQVIRHPVIPSAPATAGPVETSSSVLLIPLGLAVTYRVPLRSGLTPHVTAGPLLQIVRTRNTGASTGEVTRTDVAFGVVGLLGLGYRLGPGGLFAQAGYQWSPLDNDDLELQAGGLIVEAGYRLEL